MCVDLAWCRVVVVYCFCFFKQKTAYEMRISDWSSDVCSSDLDATMAPPSTRRPGFSRRAQYGLFIGYVVAVGGVLFAVLLLIVAILDPKGFNVLRGAALAATLPISSAGRSAIRGVTNSGDMVSNYFLAASQKIGRASCRERECHYVEISVVD